MKLTSLDLNWDPDDVSLPDGIAQWIEHARERITAFWDARSPKASKSAEANEAGGKQYVECDFEYVARILLGCQQNGLFAAPRFLEWGCGFGVMTGVAEMLGMDSIGIEAESFLVRQARKLLQTTRLDAEVWHGNFLPIGASELADASDPRVALSFSTVPAYEKYGGSLSDFGLVYCYPWPGEEHFLKLVFAQHAAPGTLLVLYRGPFHFELYQNQ